MLFATGVYIPHAPQRVISGAGRLDQLEEEAKKLDATRVLVVTSPSVVTRTPLIARIRKALGNRCVGIFDQVEQHSPVHNLVDGAELARRFRADALISCGGGSAIDVSKGIALMLASGAVNSDHLEPWFADATCQGGRRKLSRRVPHIAVPTTASGAEFTGIIGATARDHQRRKRLILDEALAPDAVVLDPAVTLTTPITLWLSSAVRALDHAVEALYGRAASPLTETLALRAIALLFDALPRTRADGCDIPSRLNTQIATWHATWAAARAGTGLSHGIGYVLGAAYDVPHGLCSCVTLAAVMKWNAPETIIPQAMIARASGRVSPSSNDATAALEASKAVDDLVGKLGLPQRLRELGYVTQDDLEAIAESVMLLPHTSSNPRIAHSKTELLELLRAAW